MEATESKLYLLSRAEVKVEASSASSLRPEFDVKSTSGSMPVNFSINWSDRRDAHGDRERKVSTGTRRDGVWCMVQCRLVVWSAVMVALCVIVRRHLASCQFHFCFFCKNPAQAVAGRSQAHSSTCAPIMRPPSAGLRRHAASALACPACRSRFPIGSSSASGFGGRRSFGSSNASPSSWYDRIRRIVAGSSSSDDDDQKDASSANTSNMSNSKRASAHRPRVIDTDTSAAVITAEGAHIDGQQSADTGTTSVSDPKPAAASTTLPAWSRHWSEEFGPFSSVSDRKRQIRRRQKLESTRRIVLIAAERVLEPSAVALLGMSASLVLGIGAAEALLLVDPIHWPSVMVGVWDVAGASSEAVEVASTGAAGGGETLQSSAYGTADVAKFVARYALEQLLPSTVWSTQDGNLVAAAMGYGDGGGGGDATAAATASLLRQLDPLVPSDASALLALGFCQTLRSMAAGFMLLAQLVRAGAIGAQAPSVYEERVRLGREPPMLPSGGTAGGSFGKEGGWNAADQPGLIVRFCGRESNIISTSLRRMGHRVFPVFEEPFSKVSHLIAQHSDGHRIPVFWSVRPDRYGSSFSWEGFPVSQDCLVRTSTGKNILLLEADATNANDPLALGDQALDLTLDDSSQGFRRIEELYANRLGSKRFRTLKVFLGNTLEVETSGGGHSYTLRHRVKYSKEVDVLIDSRAPILGEILRWCDRVTAGRQSVLSASGRKIVLFQTSSRQYFLSLQLLLEDYGYEVHDPLDWHGLSELPVGEEAISSQDNDTERKFRSLLGILNADNKKSPNAHSLQDVSRLARLPRLIYYGKTAETVNAVQALVDAGGVDAANCCALLDKEDGTRFLESNLATGQIELVQRGDATAEHNAFLRPHQSTIVEGNEGETTVASKKKAAGLHVICSSAIYDDLFRQVRQWTRMGYSAQNIQTELDGRYSIILRQSKFVGEAVAEATETEVKQEEGGMTTDEAAEQPSGASETDYFGEDIPVEQSTKP